MIAKDDIVIRKAILHILDTNRGECILSNCLCSHYAGGCNGKK